MFYQMWEFIKFLSMSAIILLLFGIIFAIISTIFTNIKLSILKTQLAKELNKHIKSEDIKIEKIIEIQKDDK